VVKRDKFTLNLTQNGLVKMKRTKFNGEQLRDKGMKVAADHAEAVILNWGKDAFDMLLEYPSTTFMTEDLRFWAYNNGLPKPPNEKAWGSIIIKAVRAGVITHQGYRKVNNPQAHARPASVWEKV
jgi:hypothetical protein